MFNENTIIFNYMINNNKNNNERLQYMLDLHGSYVIKPLVFG